MSKTKAELEAENARLREVNEALRDVLAAIGEGKPPLPADAGDMDKFHRAGSLRMDSAAIYARGAAEYRDEYIPAVLRGYAETLRKEWKRLLRYVPDAPVPEGTVTAPPQDAPYAEVIPAHDPFGPEAYKNHKPDCVCWDCKAAAEEAGAQQLSGKSGRREG